MRPGTAPPMRILATEILAMAARMMASPLGGIIMASPPPPRMGPRLMGFL